MKGVVIIDVVTSEIVTLFFFIGKHAKIAFVPTWHEWIGNRICPEEIDIFVIINRIGYIEIVMYKSPICATIASVR